MTDDIAARLRNLTGLTENLCHEAADEIERLRVTMDVLLADRRAALSENHDLWREIERLRAALEKIANGSRDADLSYLDLFVELKLEARAALAGEKTND
jgi:hypothetical protein